MSGKGSGCDKDNMATQSLSKLEEEILVCSVCLETLKEPKILGCLHRYCKQCLADVIDKSPVAETFRCPTCREEYGIPNGGIESIKGDFLVEAVLENRKLEMNLKEKQKEQICSSCDKHTTMMAICPDCGGFVCEVCHSGHKAMKTFRNHNLIVTLEDIESGKVTFNVQNMTSTLKAPKCPVHKDMILHINCQTCDKLICPVCAPIHHNTHQLEEIASAAERIKGRVHELVQKSAKSGETLETRMGEFQKIAQAKLDEILDTFEQVKRTANREEQNLRHAEKESLRELEEKKQIIKKETEENISIIRQGETFLAKEIKMLEKFCTETSKKMEEHAEEEMQKMRNTQTTAQILAKDVDNWSVLLAAPDIQHNLQVSSKDIAIKLLEQAFGSLTNLTVKFCDLKVSPLETKCWKEKWSLDLRKIDGNWFEEGHAKQNWDMKYINATAQLVTISLRHANIDISVVDIKRKIITEQNGYYFTNTKPEPPYLKIAGFQYNLIYSAVKCAEPSMQALTYINSDKSITLPFNLNVANPAVSCLAQCKNNNELIVGLCGSTTLHRCDFKAKGLSSFQVKVDGLHPPVSLTSTKEGHFLLCDGVSKAITVNGEGNLVCQFSERNLSDKPLVISDDHSGFVYVLWSTKDGKGSTGSRQKAAASHIRTTSSKVVRQYSPSGTFISEFNVGNTVTMMTTVVTDDDQDAVAVGTPEGLIQCYSMTPFGQTWSNFIREQGIK